MRYSFFPSLSAGHRSDQGIFFRVGACQPQCKIFDELIAIAEQLKDNEEVDLTYQGKTYRYPKRFFLVHAMEHSTEHRTEVKVALAQIGIETPELDGWNYSQSAGYGQEITTRS